VVTPLDVDAIRARFPALSREENGHRLAFLDGPGGTQVPESVIEAMRGYLARGNSNLGGAFGPSREAEQVEADARGAVADLLGAAPTEVVFGQNMTSLTFSMSRALAREWRSGDSVVVTRLDHDANVSPWRLAAADRGAAVIVADLDPADVTLDLSSLDRALATRPRLVAVTAASNAVGSVTPVAEIVARAHAAGALVYVDAVHHSAHRVGDLHGWDADFIAASAYKFFGPHTGVLVAKAEHLERLDPYKVTPAPDRGPAKWETGTQSFESLAGVTAAIDHLASLGEGDTRRARLTSAFARIRGHEESLTARFLAGVADIRGIRIHGITDPDRLGDRVSTFALDVDGVQPREVARRLGERGLLVWDGHYYAIAVMERLGLLESGGLTRIGFVHYTAPDEVDRTLDALADVVA
jgi:cysteine desulfurase family protein (TIGR01976 family)